MPKIKKGKHRSIEAAEMAVETKKAKMEETDNELLRKELRRKNAELDTIKAQLEKMREKTKEIGVLEKNALQAAHFYTKRAPLLV
uniref:Uncharacterized protein n=1 Tax=Acrobeloides nanus TaxID=290746 RepID=A0A914DGW8_9BILA